MSKRDKSTELPQYIRNYLRLEGFVWKRESGYPPYQPGYWHAWQSHKYSYDRNDRDSFIDIWYEDNLEEIRADIQRYVEN